MTELQKLDIKRLIGQTIARNDKQRRDEINQLWSALELANDKIKELQQKHAPRDDNQCINTAK